MEVFTLSEDVEGINWMKLFEIFSNEKDDDGQLIFLDMKTLEKNIKRKQLYEQMTRDNK